MSTSRATASLVGSPLKAKLVETSLLVAPVLLYHRAIYCP